MEATLTATTDPIYDGIRRLAALDTDRATLENGLGFSGTDTKYGHILAATPREGWTREMVYVAYNIARRYANTQLSDLNWDAIPEPEHKNEWTGKRSFTPGRVLAWEPTGKKYTGQPVFVLTFPKQFNLIAKVRSLPKRAWGADDRDDRGWEAPVTRANAEAIKRLVEDWAFTVLPQAQTALDEVLAGPQMETTVNSLRIELGQGVEYKGQVALIFSPYEREDVRDAIRKLPIRRWSRTRENKAWEVPYRADALLPVFDLAQEYGFEVTFDLAGLVEGELASRAANLVASRASDTDFVITGSAREPYPFQRAGIEYAVNNLKPGQGVLIADAMGLGKALANGTRVLTPWGWTPIQDLEIGSWVIGVDGKPHRVIGVYPQGDRDLFRVSFSDGTSVVADKDHLWAVRTADGRYQDDFEEVLTTEKIAERGTRTSAGNAVHFIPMVAPVEFEPESPLPLHPYVLGALLGDGGLTTATPCLTTVDSELLERVTSLLPEGVAAVRTEEDGLSYRLVGDGARFEKNPLTTALRSLGLMGKHSWEKAVPHRYLFGTVEERVETLRGLMDTDGHAGVIAEFTTTSEQLGHDVMFLVQSLGGVARWASKATSYRNRAGEKVEGRRAYRLTITLDINPFSLSRKANAWKPNEKYPARRSITSVESVGTGSATCIAVDAVDQLFVTEHCIVTHNTIQGILTAHMVEGTPVLVVAPASLKLVWEREIKATLPQASVAIVNGTKGDLPVADWTIANYDILAKRLDQLLARGFKTVIGDEGHYLKNKKAQRTRAFTEIVKSATYTLLLSGTFTLNRPIELTSPLDVIGRLGSFGGFMPFAKRYCGAYKGTYGWEFDGAVDELLPELNDLMRSQCYVRRTKEQVLTELPPKVRADRPVEITNRKEYREAEEDIVAYSYKAALESKAFYKSLAGLSKEQSQAMRQDHANNAAMKASRAKVLTQIAKTKRLAGQGKMAALTELVESLRAENEPFIIFAWHTDLVEEIGRTFAIPVIHGGVSQQARDRAVTSLTTGKVDGIGGNIGAMGVGLTMVKCGTRPITNVIFVEYGWNPGTMDQAEDRAHRIGQVGDSVTIHRLYGSQTIDEDSIALIEHKRRVVDAVTEGLPVTEEEEADIEFLIERIKRRLSNLPSEDSEDEIKRWIGKR